MQRFICEKTAKMYKSSTGGSYEAILILGDEVEIDDDARPEDGRFPITVRGRKGWISGDKLDDQRMLEMYFIDVGTGDSSFIVTPGGKTILVDGGLDRRALGFLAWKYRLGESDSSLDIDLLVLSHADDDHLGGLIPLITHPRIHVKRIVHSGVATYAKGKAMTRLGDISTHAGERYLTELHSSLEELDESALSTDFGRWRDAIAATGTRYEAVDASCPALDIGDPAVRLEVLGPRRIAHPVSGRPCLPWLGGDGPTINGHSVVLRLVYGSVSILLPGDINRAGAEHLLADPAIRARLAAHVFKAPHHGSQDFAPELLDWVRPQVTVISSGDDRDHGHPRASFVGAVGKHSRSATPLVFSTEIAARFSPVREPSAPDDETGDDIDAESPEGLNRLRGVFKRRLHGMINVRTDGRKLFAARRVDASYYWEAYGPFAAAPAQAR